MSGLPIPADLPLAIPGSILLFKILLVFSFILHILFVNVLLGGTVTALFVEYLGIKRKDPGLDRLAKTIAAYSFINKSIAVVLGVAPLLLLSVLYTGFFYSSTVLMGRMWMALIPILIISFLFIVAYEFSWNSLGHKKSLHMLLGICGALPLLFVPLVFSANMVLMLNPGEWLSTKGFWQALFYPTVLPRYLHFMLACFALTGLLLLASGKMGGMKATGPEEFAFQRLVSRSGARLAFYGTAGQLVAGPLLLFSQPRPVLSSLLGGGNTWLLAMALVLAALVLVLLFRAMKEAEGAIITPAEEHLPSSPEIAAATEPGPLLKKCSTRWILAVCALLLLLFTMGTLRHQVRELHLAPHRQASHSELLYTANNPIMTEEGGAIHG
jgi:cytochrome c